MPYTLPLMLATKYPPVPVGFCGQVGGPPDPVSGGGGLASPQTAAVTGCRNSSDTPTTKAHRAIVLTITATLRRRREVPWRVQLIASAPRGRSRYGPAV